MTKSELITKIAQKNPNLTLKEVEKIVSIVFSEIVSALSVGNRVEFRGFGAFSVRSRAPRTAKNPKTGKQVSIGERRIVHFKTGKELHHLLNPEK